MHKGYFCLALVLLLLPVRVWAEPAGKPDVPVQQAIDSIRKMDRDQQQAWLMQLEQRAARAAKLTLSPEQAAEENQKLYALLHRKLITWDVLREAIHETNSIEHNAVEQLVERYRAEVEKAFPDRPDVWAKRQADWQAYYAQWQQAGGLFESQTQLLDWLETNLKDAATLPVLDKDVAATPTPADTAVKEPEAKTSEIISIEPELDVTELQKQDQNIAEEQEKNKVAPLQAAEDAVKLSPMTPDIETPPSEDESITLPAENSVPIVKDEVVEPQELKTDESYEPELMDEVFGTPLPKEELELPQLGETTKQQPAEKEEQPEALPLEESKTAESKEELPPEQLLPETVANDLPENTSSDEDVAVKLEELTARIDGYNLGVRGLEMELDEKGDWNASRLTPLVERLELLSLRRNDLELVRNIVPEENRASLAELASLKGAADQMATRLAEAKTLATGPRYDGDEAERKAELQQLERLGQRLANLAEQK